MEHQPTSSATIEHEPTRPSFKERITKAFEEINSRIEDAMQQRGEITHFTLYGREYQIIDGSGEKLGELQARLHIAQSLLKEVKEDDFLKGVVEKYIDTYTSEIQACTHREEINYYLKMSSANDEKYAVAA